jgi:hypothetical protein
MKKKFMSVEAGRINLLLLIGLALHVPVKELLPQLLTIEFQLIANKNLLL